MSGRPFSASHNGDSFITAKIRVVVDSRRARRGRAKHSSLGIQETSLAVWMPLLRPHLAATELLGHIEVD